MKKFLCLICVLALALCGTAFADQVTHYFGDWTQVRPGEHVASCELDGCDFRLCRFCSKLSAEYNGETLSTCPVCGAMGQLRGQLLRATTLIYNYSNAPEGDICVFRYDAPLQNEDVLCAFSIVFEYGGKIEEYDGCSIPRIYTVMDGDFDLIHLTHDGPEKIDYDYDAEAGILSFNLRSNVGIVLAVKSGSYVVEYDEVIE